MRCLLCLIRELYTFEMFAFLNVLSIFRMCVFVRAYVRVTCFITWTAFGLVRKKWKQEDINKARKIKLKESVNGFTDNQRHIFILTIASKDLDRLVESDIQNVRYIRQFTHTTMVVVAMTDNVNNLVCY